MKINVVARKYSDIHIHFQTVLGSIGVSIWQMAVAPFNDNVVDTKPKSEHFGNGFLNDKLNKLDDDETSESEDDSDSVEQPVIELPRLAIGCDDGCVRIYSISDSDELIYTKSLPRVSGEIPSLHFICLLSLRFFLIFFFQFRIVEIVILINILRTCFKRDVES